MPNKSRKAVNLGVSTPSIRTVTADAPQVIQPVRPGGFVQSQLLESGTSKPTDTPSAAVRVREGGLVRGARGGHGAVPAHLKNAGRTVAFDNGRNRTMEVLSGLGRLVPGIVDSYNRYDQKAQSEADSEALKEFNIRGHGQSFEDVQTYLADKEERFKESYQALYGKQLGGKATEEVLDTYNKNKGAFQDEEAFNEMVQKKSQQYLEQVDDENFAGNFIPAFERGEAKVRSIFKRNMRNKLVVDTKEAFYGGLVDDLNNAVQDQLSVEDTVSGIQQYRDAQASGNLALTSGEVDELVFEGVVNSATETNNANLLQVLDHMDYGNNPQYHEKLLVAKDRIARRIKKDQALGSGTHELSMMMGLKKGAQEGTLTMAQGERAVNAGLSPNTVANLMLASQTKAVEIRQRETRANMFTAGPLTMIAAKASMTKQEANIAFEDAIERVQNKVSSGDMDQETGEDYIMMMSEAMGKLPKSVHLVINDAPVGSQGFVEASAQYQALKKTHRELIGGNVSDSRAAQLDVYHMAIKAGMSPDQATERVRAIGDPDNLKAADKKINKGWGAAKEVINDRLIDRTGFSNAYNNVYINHTIKQHVKLLVSDGVTSVEEATLIATERFEETHRFLPDGGFGSDGVWVDTRGREVPKGFENAWQIARAEIAEKLKGSANEDEGGYYVMPASTDKRQDSWQVYRRSTGLPVVGLTVSAVGIIANANKVKKQEVIDDWKRRKSITPTRGPNGVLFQ